MASLSFFRSVTLPEFLEKEGNVRIRQQFLTPRNPGRSENGAFFPETACVIHALKTQYLNNAIQVPPAAVRGGALSTSPPLRRLIGGARPLRPPGSLCTTMLHGHPAGGARHRRGPAYPFPGGGALLRVRRLAAQHLNSFIQIDLHKS